MEWQRAPRRPLIVICTWAEQLNPTPRKRVEEKDEYDPDLQQLRPLEDSLDQRLQALQKTWSASSTPVKEAFIKHFLPHTADQSVASDPLSAFEFHAKEAHASKPRKKKASFSEKATYRMKLRSCDLLMRTALVRLKSLGVLERTARESHVGCALLEIKEPFQEALTAQQNIDAVGFADLLPLIQYQSTDLSGLKPSLRSQRVPRRMAAHLAESLRVFDLSFSQDSCLHVFLESSLDSLQTEWNLVAKTAAEEGEAAALVRLAEHDLEALDHLQKAVKKHKRLRVKENNLRQIVRGWGADWSVESVIKYSQTLQEDEDGRLLRAQNQKAAYVDSFKDEASDSDRVYPSIYALFIGLL
ncbi:hypothetical protein Emag_002335 [Eimeria magna]